MTETPEHVLHKKGRQNPLKDASVRQRVCIECRFGVTHETGSLIWIECKLQNNGWKSISSMCNLPDKEFLRLAKRREGK
jgi:hypothetical protein